MTALSECPSCGSELVQPLRWEQTGDGEVLNGPATSPLEPREPPANE